MANMYANHCMFIGRLTGNPELVHDEKADRTNFTIAINSPHSRRPMYLRCVAWNENAHKIAGVCRKGYEVAVQGELDISTYQDKKYPDVRRTGVALKISAFSVGSRPTYERAAVRLPDPPL